MSASDKFLVAWLNVKPYCWCASTDGGQTWEKLSADNDEDSSEAIDEAAEKYGMATNKWDLLDDPIILSSVPSARPGKSSGIANQIGNEEQS